MFVCRLSYRMLCILFDDFLSFPKRPAISSFCPLTCTAFEFTMDARFVAEILFSQKAYAVPRDNEPPGNTRKVLVHNVFSYKQHNKWIALSSDPSKSAKRL